MSETVLITGASSGIGKELAIVYAANLYNLILVARSKNKLDDLKQELEKTNKIEVTNISLDLSNQDSAEELYGIVKEKKLQVDILINNAGFGLNGEFTEIDINSQTEMINLNMLTLTKLSNLFAKEMTVQNFGKIVNIASTAAFQPITNFAVYAATKAYVLSFSEAIAVELKSKNISITAICPGATESNFMDSAGVKKISMLSIASSKQVAEFTYRAVNKEKIVAIHGFLNRLIVVAIRFTPRSIVRKLSGSFFDN